MVVPTTKGQKMAGKILGLSMKENLLLADVLDDLLGDDDPFQLTEDQTATLARIRRHLRIGREGEA